jgi:aromatic-L-amino-acid/L-tryptophan decarboxylase
MTTNRKTPIEINREEFKRIGYHLIDSIADFIETIGDRPVTSGESSRQLQKILGHKPLPETGRPAEELLSESAELLFNHSLLNGHPKFLGYITSSPAPIGALADLLATAVNPNAGAQILSPIATEIEKQTVNWLAEFIGVGPGYGGLLVSGGNMANLTAFFAAIHSKTQKNSKDGLINSPEKLRVYCPKTTHIWIEKAAHLSGIGSGSIRWIQTDTDHRMDIDALERAIQDDLKDSHHPIMAIGTAGDVSTGAVDNLKAVAAICRKYDLWFHVDGAYGIPAAIVPELKPLFDGIAEADSIALDPHKWLYSPLEAGCTLVKNPRHLTDTYSSHPEYYNFGSRDEDAYQNFYEYGLQNSRGFKAFKVWLALQQVGKNGYIKMIREDIELSRLFFELARNHPELEAVTQNLSITTLRYVPINRRQDDENEDNYLNSLNEALLNELQQGGKVFLSNAIVNQKYCLRGCIVNFRTSEKDISEIIDIIVKEGKNIQERYISHPA